MEEDEEEEDDEYEEEEAKEEEDGRNHFKVYDILAPSAHGHGKPQALKKNASALTPSTSSIIWSYHLSHIPNKKYVGKLEKNGLE